MARTSGGGGSNKPGARAVTGSQMTTYNSILRREGEAAAQMFYNGAVKANQAARRVANAELQKKATPSAIDRRAPATRARKK